MTKLWNIAIKDLKKNNVNLILATIKKDNISSKKFCLKMGMKQITDNKEMRRHMFFNPNKELYYKKEI